jgi:hypothetical protein
LNLCGQYPYSEGSPQSIRLWFPGPRGSPPRVSRGDLVLTLLLQTFLSLRGARTTKPSNFQPHYLNVELILRSNLLLELLERGRRELGHRAAAEASQMQMVLPGLDFVVMLFAVQVHQIELIDHAQPFEQLERPVHRSSINVRIPLASKLQEALCIQMSCGLLNGRDEGATLGSQPYSSGLYFTQQFAAWQQEITFSCDSVAIHHIRPIWSYSYIRQIWS